MKVWIFNKPKNLTVNLLEVLNISENKRFNICPCCENLVDGSNIYTLILLEHNFLFGSFSCSSTDKASHPHAQTQLKNHSMIVCGSVKLMSGGKRSVCITAHVHSIWLTFSRQQNNMMPAEIFALPSALHRLTVRSATDCSGSTAAWNKNACWCSMEWKMRTETSS